MRTSLVLTVIGDDRPGLVSALSDTIAAWDGNWTETRMASLGGKFAGILLVTVPQAKADALIGALRGLEAQSLHLVIQRSNGAAPAGGRLLVLDLIGQDRPGIVRDISHLLAEHGINIEELDTACVSGSFSGEALFKAQARLRVPRKMATAELRTLLEALANELMVDVSLDEAASNEN
ncbi:MAG: ACT domain-containing protein [Burkholderiales bacterium]|nr:ACT domain-containing protein [Burkholderiales bacterium]